MATVLNIKKAKQEIRLDDSPDSPVYILDLTDKSVVKKGKKVYSEYQKNKAAFDRIDDGSSKPEDVELQKRIWRLTIETCLGAKAYNEIVDYVVDGDESLDDGDILLLLTPVVLYLLEQIQAVVTANNNSAVLKYARSKSAAAGAI